jgi:hypothetical protein
LAKPEVSLFGCRRGVRSTSPAASFHRDSIKLTPMSSGMRGPASFHDKLFALG